jgi:hypothetical protein
VDYTTQTCALLETCIEELCAWLPSQSKAGEDLPDQLKALTQAWYNFVHDDPRTFWNRATTKVREAKFKAEYVQPLSVDEVRRAHDIAGYWRKHRIGNSVTEFGALLQRMDQEEKGRLRLLFVVDETKELNVASGHSERFTWFTRALTGLPYSSDEPLSFCVFTDTTSEVANLTPVKALDASFRVRDPLKKSDLFPPCTVVDSLDSWWHSVNRVGDSAIAQYKAVGLMQTLGWMRRKLNDASVKSNSTSNEAPLKGQDIPMALLESFEFMSMFGRPAFYALLQKRGSPLDASAIRALIDLLQTKLLRQDPTSPPTYATHGVFEDDEVLELANTRRGIAKVSSFTQMQALSVLGVIASIDISVSSKLSSELSAGHMRLLGAISNKR